MQVLSLIALLSLHGRSTFIENGGDLPTLQDLLGHADVRTTRIYVRAAAQGRRQEVERVHL